MLRLDEVTPPTISIASAGNGSDRNAIADDRRGGRNSDLSAADRVDRLTIDPREIIVSGRFRKNLDEPVVKSLMESIALSGLRTPPSTHYP